MNARRVLLGSALTLALLFSGALLYLTLGDLSVHKPRIERFVAKHTGREFTIQGPFELKLLPALSVVAEDVRLGNAPWGSQPSMVEIGRFATVIDVWSLISGPIEIRSLELRDVAALLETNTDGKGNWEMQGSAAAPAPQAADKSGASGIPLILHESAVENLRITYRKPGAEDRVALLNSLRITQQSDNLLAILADGALHDYPTKVQGQVGPIDALVSGRNLRVAIDASVGRLGMKLNGSIGRLDPLDGMNLECKLDNPDVGTMLERLRLPVVATGSLNVDAVLKDAGERTSLNLHATAGDIVTAVAGSLQTLGLTGSDLEFTATVEDAARLAAVFGVQDVPREQLRAKGHVATSDAQLDIKDFSASLAGAQVHAKGSIPRSSSGGPKLRFDASVENLARLHAGMPKVPVKASATYAGSSSGFEVRKLQALIGKTELSGSLSAKGTAPRRIVAQLSSPRVELAALLEKEKAPDTKNKSAAAAAKKAGGKKSQNEFVFNEKPLPLDKLRQVNAQVQMSAAEVVLDTATLADVAGKLNLEDGRLAADLHAKGTEGTIASAIHLIPSQKGAELTLHSSVEHLRIGMFAPEGEDRRKGPATSLRLDIRASGSSPRELAAGASGRILVTQDEGRVKSGLLDMFGSDILTQIGGQLNPFSAHDPAMTMQCTVAQVDIANGEATIKPVLIQSDKVTVTGQGKIDLHTEHLTFDFNTRPREGIGISAGMFANPFVSLAGTLAHPRLGTGAKGVASGALAVGTAGVSVVAKGAVDRVAGEADLCKTTLAEVSGKPAPAFASDN